MANRFLLLDRSLRAGGSTTAAPADRRSRLVRQATKEERRCAQFSEIAIEDDAFVIDVLSFFFDERLQPSQLNDDLRDVAARAVWEANRASRSMDLVPRPPSGVPDVEWLVEEAVQIAIRSIQNKCIYEAVRVTVKARMRSEYELAKSGVMSMSAAAPSVRPEEAAAPPATRVRRTTSPDGIDMIAGFETFHPAPYEDAAGDCRIGYGHLAHEGPCDGSEDQQYPEGLTETKARELLAERVRQAEGPVNGVAHRGVAQHQFDALVSFVVNVGPEVFERSRVPELVRDGGWKAIPAELRLWVNAEGVPVAELTKRRAAEARLFETGEYPRQAALTTARSLGVDLREVEEPYVREMTAPAVDWCQIRHGIVRSAVEMQGAWLRAGNTLHGEGAATVLPYLVQFWRDGVGMTPAQAEATARISASDHPSQGFWSAAFISWCVRNALPSPPPPHDGGFRFSGLHMVYIAEAARNREAGDTARPFWLFDINDPDIVPEDGDIVCLNRSGTSHSYASVRRKWVVDDPTGRPTGKSHTDIVIGHHDDGSRRWIETVGGNVDDTVGSTYYSLTADGRLDSGVTLTGAPVGRRSDVTQTVGGRPPIVFALIRLTACPGL
jgi:GH24 family phage-related lysozyme (muramidase)